MPPAKSFESRPLREKTFSPDHSDPGAFWKDFILLPYGEFYEKTKSFLEAKKGDSLRFFNGDIVKVYCVTIIDDERLCDILCRIRYGAPWEMVLSKWTRYARMEGYGKDVFSKSKIIMIVFDRKNECIAE